MKTLVILLSFVHQLLAFCHGSDGNGLVDWRKYISSIQGTHINILAVDLLEHTESRSFLHCCTLCHVAEGCRGVAYAERECWLINGTASRCQLFKDDCSTCQYKLVMRDLKHNNNGSDCRDLLDKGINEDGVYIINPAATAPFQAFCDMTNGGWTVFQRRVDDSVDFYRGWADYVAGFGNFSGNFWAGLDNIHSMTSCESIELLVTMKTFEGEIAEAHYSSFFVSDAASGYRMCVRGYSGTAGDCMITHNAQKFSTYDNDQDTSSSNNCAERHFGAWWYSHCYSANPNGLYLHNGTTDQGVVWYYFKGWSSLKTMEFKVRCT